MKYDFETIIDRHNKDSVAVDVPESFGPQGETKEGFSRIPMWIADMNFACVPTIQEEMIKRIQHPCFGYFETSDAYYQSILDWQANQNGVKDLKKENISYENGVLGGFVTALHVLANRGDYVLAASPTYIGFQKCIFNNGYHLVTTKMYLDEDGIWRMDYEDLEKKIQEYNIHVFILCSPHNPTGRVFQRDELAHMYEIFERYEVDVISDEIWSDLILDGYHHIPSQSVSEYAKMHTIALYSLGKTFSLAGIVSAYHICYNKKLDQKLRKEASLSHYNSMNVLSMHALIGAYKKEGYEWLEQLNHVLTKNVDLAFNFFHDEVDGVNLAKPQGTYMLYLDCSEYLKAHDICLQELLDRGVSYGILWQNGEPFGFENTIRMNLAIPHSLLKEALDRLDQYVF